VAGLASMALVMFLFLVFRPMSFLQILTVSFEFSSFPSFQFSEFLVFPFRVPMKRVPSCITLVDPTLCPTTSSYLLVPSSHTYPIKLRLLQH
jgi:hypothetical protein